MQLKVKSVRREQQRGAFEAELLARAGVQFLLNRIQLRLREHAQVTPIWQEGQRSRA